MGLSGLKIASQYNKLVLSANAEKEVERLLRALLPGSPYEGKVKAVGGYVRDEYLKKIKEDSSIDPKDLDIVVNMKDGAEKVTHYIHDKLKGFISTPYQMGKGYPIWQITFKKDTDYKGETYGTEGAVIEFADTMKESYPDADSRQRKTEPADLEEDIARRDFTVNMLTKDLTTGEIEDFTGSSKKDIEKGILKGHPGVSLDSMFKNDPLRMLRLFRFKSKYDWDIPLHVLRAVKRNAERIEIVSSERIMGELKKIMEYGKLSEAIKLMSSTKILKYILPEVESMKKVKQSPIHHQEGDVYKHTLMVLKNTAPGVENQIGALLHDIGKPGTTLELEDKITSYGHEEVGAEMAEAILKRLKFDKDTTRKVKDRIRNHMRPHSLGADPSDKAIRKFVRSVGDDMVDSILDMARADELGKIPATNNIPDLKKKIDKVREESKKDKPTNKALLSGKEVMDLLNISSGPQVGVALKIVEDIEDDYFGKGLTKEKAREELKKRFKRRKESVVRVAKYFLSRTLVII